jgi:hypothetical protein
MVAAFLLVGATVASAQTQTSRGYVAPKAGVNAERAEDNLRGASAGGGVITAVHLSRACTVEGEFWYPGYIRTDPEDGRHQLQPP